MGFSGDVAATFPPLLWYSHTSVHGARQLSALVQCQPDSRIIELIHSGLRMLEKHGSSTVRTRIHRQYAVNTSGVIEDRNMPCVRIDKAQYCNAFKRKSVALLCFSCFRGIKLLIKPAFKIWSANIRPSLKLIQIILTKSRDFIYVCCLMALRLFDIGFSPRHL